ncbi:hypothetical protein HZC30_00920 [Candidatus Woesearchaeota archaeon]|nr:hypothetical protein [Candidatus Woesearchaeota archaeon]
MTKDIDLVVLTKKEYDRLKSALVNLGYSCHEETFSPNFYKTSIIVFMKDDRRIDVFIKTVCSQLELTKEIQNRSERYAAWSNLEVRLVSSEDIFLFKSITDREKDVDDCRVLIGEGLDWKVIKQELHRQEGKALWRFWVYEQLCRIRNKYGEIIPRRMLNYIWKLVKEKWPEKPQDFMAGIEDERWGREIEKSTKHNLN